MPFAHQGPRLRRSTLLGAIAGACVAFVACTVTPSSSNTSESELVGGRQATDDEFPSTLLIATNCTAAKIGPRHVLTAGHCVDDNALFAAGSTLHLTSKKAADSTSPNDAAFVPVVVEKTYVHSTWEAGTGPVKVLGPTLAADVAIVVLTRESQEAIADIPIATVDSNPVAPGDKLVVMGYGCEAGLYSGFDYAQSRLKIQSTVALSRDEAIAPGRYPEPSPGVRIEDNYLFTPGAKLDSADAASLCPGDSGGPVYRDDGTQRVIVGVNAYYNFQPNDPSYVSLTNWHTRLDAQAGYGVGAWVQSIVANGAPDPIPNDAGTDGEADASAPSDVDASADAGDPLPEN